MTTTKEFLESKPLTLSKDIFDGYKITYSYLDSLLKEYAQIRVKELSKTDNNVILPTNKEIVKKAEEFIGDYNGCNDHYVKRAYMVQMAEWLIKNYLK